MFTCLLFILYNVTKAAIYSIQSDVVTVKSDSRDSIYLPKCHIIQYYINKYI